MIKELFVKICKEYEKNQLILTVDENPRGRYLVLEHPTNSYIAYEININGGHLLIGLNNFHILNSLELNIYKEDWKHLEGNFVAPKLNMKGCVEFLNMNRKHCEYEVPLNVYTDQRESAVWIEIESHKEPEAFWVAISNYCFVNILDNQLIGFWINLSVK